MTNPPPHPHKLSYSSIYFSPPKIFHFPPPPPQSTATPPPPPPPPPQAAAEGDIYEMVGLSVILENYKDLAAKRSPQVINKGSMIKPTLSSPTSPLSFSCFSSNNNNNKNNNNNNNVSSSNISTTCGFLEICFLCKEKLMPGKDIYMYKGDRAFCSVECRCKQILMDEEETTTAAKSGCTREYNCSLVATSSSSSSRRSSVSKKGTRNRANYNGFAY